MVSLQRIMKAVDISKIHYYTNSEYIRRIDLLHEKNTHYITGETFFQSSPSTELSCGHRNGFDQLLVGWTDIGNIHLCFAFHPEYVPPLFNRGISFISHSCLVRHRDKVPSW